MTGEENTAGPNDAMRSPGPPDPEGQPHYPPPTPHNLWYPHPSVFQRRKKKTNVQYLPAAEMLMFIAGIFGIVFWLSHFLMGYMFGNLDFEVGNEGWRQMFGFSIIMFMSSLVLLQGPYYIRTRNFRMSFFAALFGIFSFGWVVGSLMSAICLIIVVHNVDEFMPKRDEDEERESVRRRERPRRR